VPAAYFVGAGLGGLVGEGTIDGTIVGEGTGSDGDGNGVGVAEGDGDGEGEGSSPLQLMWSVPVRKMSGVPSHALPSTSPSGRLRKPLYSAGRPFTKYRMMVSPTSSP
jgi:hypothetical protein